MNSYILFLSASVAASKNIHQRKNDGEAPSLGDVSEALRTLSEEATMKRLKFIHSALRSNRKPKGVCFLELIQLLPFIKYQQLLANTKL
jgi:hypothetical protein